MYLLLGLYIAIVHGQNIYSLYIVACQAHPALVKIGPVLVPSFYF